MCKALKNLKKIIWRVIAILFLLLIFAVLLFIKKYPSVCEWYTTTVSRAYQTGLGTLIAPIPFSIMEVLAVVCIGLALFFVISAIVLFCKLKPLKAVVRLLNVVLMGSFILVLYFGTSELAYNREKLEINYYSEKVEKTDFCNIISYFINDINDCCSSLEFREDGEVVIRTNSNTFTIDASLDTVSHYGFAAEVFCNDVAVGTYNECGVVGRLIYDDEQGKIVIADTARVFCYMNSTADTAADFEASENVITYVKSNGEHNLEEHTVCNPVTHIVSIYQCDHGVEVEKVIIGNYIYILCHTCGSFYQYDSTQPSSDGSGFVCVETNDATEANVEDPVTKDTDKAKTITADDLASKQAEMQIAETDIMAISYMTKMQVETTQQIIAIGAENTITWSSSDTSIATVDENGLVKAIAKGKVTIIANTGDQIGACLIEVTNDEPVDVEKKNSVRNETKGKNYNSLESAVSEADAGDVIKLYNDINVVSYSINKNLTIDLNNYTIKQTGTTNVLNSATVIYKNGSITSNNAAMNLYIKDEAVVTLQNIDMIFSTMNTATSPAMVICENAKLIIDKDSKIEDSCASYENLGNTTIYMCSEEYTALNRDDITTENPKLDIYGEITSSRSIINGYGGDGIKNSSYTTINIYSGAKLTSDKVGIAHLQAGTVNITGATITADTPIVAKSGTFNIFASTLHATGKSELSDGKVLPTEGNGYYYDGSVIFVDSRQYCYSGNMSFIVSNSTLTSDHESIIAETGYCNYSEIKTLNITNTSIHSAKTNYVLLNNSLTPLSGTFKESEIDYAVEVTYEVGGETRVRKYIRDESVTGILYYARKYITGYVNNALAQEAGKYEGGTIKEIKLLGSGDITYNDLNYSLNYYGAAYNDIGDIVIDLNGRTAVLGTSYVTLNTNRTVTIKNGIISFNKQDEAAIRLNNGVLNCEGITFNTNRGVWILNATNVSLGINNCVFSSVCTQNAVRIANSSQSSISIKNTVFTGVNNAIACTNSNNITVTCDGCTDVTKEGSFTAFNEKNAIISPISVSTVADLQNAINNGTRPIVLANDITLTQSISIAKNINLDLNNHSLSVGEYCFTLTGGTLSVKNGTVSGNSTYGIFYMNTNSTGSVCCESITYSGTRLVLFNRSGNIQLKNCSITCSECAFRVFKNDTTGLTATIEIQSTTFNDDNKIFSIAAGNSANVTWNGHPNQTYTDVNWVEN